MHFPELKEETKELIKALTLAGVAIVLFNVFLNNLSIIGKAISFLIKAFQPFLYGLVFTFVLIPLRDLFEKKCFLNGPGLPNGRTGQNVLLHVQHA